MCQSIRKYLSAAIILLISVLSLSASGQNFEPGFEFKMGINTADFNGFEVEDEEIEGDSLFGVTLEYHFTPDWSGSMLITHVDECFIFCNSGRVNENGELVNARYEANVFQFAANYRPQISEKFSWMLSAGAVIADEDIQVETCTDYSFGLFGSFCGSDAQVAVNNDSNTEFGVLLGAGINFQMTTHWALQLTTSYSDLRDGLQQTGFTVSYKF